MPTVEEILGPRPSKTVAAAPVDPAKPSVESILGKKPEPKEPMGRMEEFGYEALGAGKRAVSDIAGAAKGVAKLATESPEEMHKQLANVEWSKVPNHILESVMEDVKGYALAPRPQTKEEAERIGGSTMGVVEDIFGAKGIGKTALQGAGAVAGGFVGATSRASEASARALEKAGIKLEPRQVRATKPESSPGFGGKNIEKNQAIQNRVMGEETGRIADKGQQLDRKYIDERKATLGSRYSQIYTKDREFAFPESIMDELKDFYEQEASIGPAGVPVKTTAGKILDQFSKTTKQPGALSINGEGLQRLRTDLLEKARSATSSADKNAAYKLVGLLDDTVESNYPGLKKVMGDLNKQYRATIALDELERVGAIKNGDVSGQKAGAFFRQHESVGTKTQREFGLASEDVKLQARWEPSGGEEIQPKKGMIKSVMQVLNVAPRTQAARLIQSRIRSRMKGGMMTTADDAANAADIEEFVRANAGPAIPAGGSPPPAPAPFNNPQVTP